MYSEKVLQTIKNILRRFSLREVCVFACFVVFAALIWYAHAMSSVRSAVVPMVVKYTGVPEDILLSDSLPTTISLELRDAGRRLKMYSDNPLSYSFNIGEQLKRERGTFTLSSDVIHTAVNSLLQGTTKLQSISPEQIVGTYARQHSKEVPIRLVADITPAAQYQLVGQPTLLTKKVTVLGSSKQLNEIDSVETLPLVLKDIKDSIVLTATIAPLPNVRFAQNEVQVRVVTEQFTEKVIVKPIKTKNVPEGTHLRIFPSEVSVMLRIGIAHFNDVDEKDVEVWCKYPTQDVDRLPVQVSCRKPYVTVTRCTPAAVEFIIEQTHNVSQR